MVINESIVINRREGETIIPNWTFLLAKEVKTGKNEKIRILNLGLISNCELVTAHHIVFNLDFNPNLMFRTKLLTFLVTWYIMWCMLRNLLKIQDHIFLEFLQFTFKLNRRKYFLRFSVSEIWISLHIMIFQQL